MHTILLSVTSKETRLAIKRDQVLHDLIIERKKATPVPGNIYRGKVDSVLTGIQSAFINIGMKDNGFVHISEVLSNLEKLSEFHDLEISEEDRAHMEKVAMTTNISDLMPPGKDVIVQVVKEPIGSKGARLTSNISLAGRYLVLTPTSPGIGVSRKITDDKFRLKLKKLIRSLDLPKNVGLICRTASRNATEEMFKQEALDLIDTWNGIMEKYNRTSTPNCLYEEADLVKRAVLLAIEKKYPRIITDDKQTYLRCLKLYEKYEHEHPLKIELYGDKSPMLERFGIEKEIEKAFRRKVFLPSGGYLYFDQTEAMVTIDVNTGSGKGSKSSTDVEANIVEVNKEAAEEIARQLRIRNIGGLVIVDFIDMRSSKSRKMVFEHFSALLEEDSAKCTLAPKLSEFGLLEMTRQRTRQSLAQTLMVDCPYCSGRGKVKSNETVYIEIERALKRVAGGPHQKIELTVHPELDQNLKVVDKNKLIKQAEDKGAQLALITSDSLHINGFQFLDCETGKQIDV